MRQESTEELPDFLLTAADAAKFCACSKASIARGTRSRALVAVGQGRLQRFTKNDLLTWLRSRGTDQPHNGV